MTGWLMEREREAGGRKSGAKGGEREERKNSVPLIASAPGILSINILTRLMVIHYQETSFLSSLFSKSLADLTVFVLCQLADASLTPRAGLQLCGKKNPEEERPGALWLPSCLRLFAAPRTAAHHGIFQARTPEWVAMPSSRGPSPPRDRTQASHVAGRFFTVSATREALGEVPQFLTCFSYLAPVTKES